MSPGSNTISYSAFARIGLRENPGKNLNQSLKKHTYILFYGVSTKISTEVVTYDTLYIYNMSRAVASRFKASCLGLALRNARWFESSWGKKFSHEISVSVWNRYSPSIVMYLGSYDSSLSTAMWTVQKNVQYVLWFAELNSVTRVQRRIWREWNVDPPTRKSIYEWDRTLRDNGSLISKTGKHSKKHMAEMTMDQLNNILMHRNRQSKAESIITKRNDVTASIHYQRIPNLTGLVDNNDVTLQRNRNKTAGRIDGYLGDCISCLCYVSKILLNFRTAISFKEKRA
ncbi:hypothetical protein ANN_26013 [Periplaneta americana]|uniref:DUF4817 domain-containing protein n=1 Tax=Periplaneta americana TaxID=6978 RepID=A0ABQ8S555_PERAM|nr:hypothetical protein ANN_26013 [Periplaneta americana]